MPAKFRLSRTDFQGMRRFRRVSGEYFSLSYGKLENRTSPGAACVVSSKVAPRAVDRNKIKRRCRSILMSHVRKGGPTIVVYARKGAAKATFQDTKLDIEHMLSKIVH